MKILAVIALCLGAVTVAPAGSDILGDWKTENDESKVEIYRCAAQICGKITWLKRPTYTDATEGEVGTPVIDRKNPDPALRHRPVLGLQILTGFSEEGDGSWGGGTCYDPKSGKTYRGKMHLKAPGRLELRGYIGIPLFGRSSVWTR
jgi:uncharacterized protein (DUF2147 family)